MNELGMIIPAQNRSSLVVFSAIDFLGAFFSELKIRNINVISSSDLLDTIGKFRDEFANLFLDINIRDNCGTICSPDIEEGISMLQILGAIGKTNPRYERIILKLNKDTANDIVKDCDKEFIEDVMKFTDKFIEVIKR